MVLVTSGPRRVPGDVAQPHHNVGRAERWISVLAGSAMAVYGLDRRDMPGGLVALLGAALIHRGATARCPVYSALGVSTAEEGGSPADHRSQPTSRAAEFRASDAVKIEQAVTVRRSPAELYAFWKTPENLPRFMDWLDAVERIDSRHERWRAKGPAGVPIEWTAEIINDIPGSLIAWKSVGDADVKNAGSVHFREAPDGTGTEVRLVFEWLPPAGRAGLAAARALGSDPDKRIRKGLDRLRELTEAADAGPSAIADY